MEGGRGWRAGGGEGVERGGGRGSPPPHGGKVWTEGRREDRGGTGRTGQSDCNAGADGGTAVEGQAPTRTAAFYIRRWAVRFFVFVGQPAGVCEIVCFLWGLEGPVSSGAEPARTPASPMVTSKRSPCSAALPRRALLPMPPWAPLGPPAVDLPAAATSLSPPATSFRRLSSSGPQAAAPTTSLLLSASHPSALCQRPSSLPLAPACPDPRYPPPCVPSRRSHQPSPFFARHDASQRLGSGLEEQEKAEPVRRPRAAERGGACCIRRGGVDPTSAAPAPRVTASLAADRCDDKSRSLGGC